THPKTVASSIKELEVHGFVSVLDGMRFRLFQLREGQLDCFADKGEWSGNSSEPDEFVNDFAAGGEKLERSHEERKALIEYLEPLPLSDKSKQTIVTKLTGHENWPNNWRPVAEECVKALLA